MEKINGANGKNTQIKSYAQAIVDTIREPLLVLDRNLRVVSANNNFYTSFEVNKEETEERLIYELGNNQWDIPLLRTLLEEILPEKKSIFDFKVSHDFESIGTRTLLVNAYQLIREVEEEEMILLSFKDVTDAQIREEEKHHLRYFETILAQAPAMICMLRGPEHVFELANKRFFPLVGNRDIIGKSVREALPEVESQGFLEMLDGVYSTGKPFIGNELPIQLDVGEKELKNSFLDFVYQPTFDAKGMVEGIFVHAVDVTEQVLTRKKVEESEQQVRSLIESAPFPIGVYEGKEMKITIANQTMLNVWGKGNDVIGKLYSEILPELGNQEIFDQLDKVYTTGVPYHANNQQVNIIIDGELKPFYFNYSFTPLLDSSGKVYGIMNTAADVTDLNLAKKKIEVSEHRYQEMIHSSPSLIATFKGEDMIIEIANNAILDAWGKNKEIIGKPLFSVMPELVEQGFKEMLQGVYKTGKPYKAYEMPVNLHRNGKMELFYFNFIYYPHRDAQGNIVGIVDMATEVTPQAILSKKIKESESHFRQMANLMPGKILNTDEKGNATYFNQHWQDSGLSFEKLKDWNWQKMIHPRDFDKFKKAWKRSLVTGNEFEMEFRCLDKNGEYNWHLSRASAVRDAEGNIEMWISATTNIQEQKQVMESLEYSKALMETHNQANIDGVLLVDTKGKIISYNQRFIEIWNMPQHIVEARNDKAALEFAEKQLISADNFLHNVKKLYNSPNKVCKDELKLRNNKIIERHGYPVVGEDGTFYAWSWTFRDITLQKNQEKSIKESELYYRQMTNLMPGMIINTDEKGNLTYFNQHWLEYTGQNKEDLKAQGWIRFIHPKQQKKFLKSWNKSLKSGEDFEMEIKLLNIIGKYKWHLSRAEAVKDESGKIKLWICTNTEIQKIKEEEKRKGDFLKMVSHELKTPVTSIKGYVQLLLSLLNNGEDKEISSLPLKPSLERIDHQIRRLTRLISEMLDLSRIEDNKLELQKETFNLNDFVTDTVQDINYTSTQHQIKVFHRFRCNVHADKDRIGQVLINFVTNAIKYSPDNQKIEITIDKEKNDQVSVSVKDKGIGIEKKHHKSLFKRFYRVGIKSEETYSGFGIGLFLAKEIVSRHKGAIMVKSKKDKGSEFIFTLNIDSGDSKLI